MTMPSPKSDMAARDVRLKDAIARAKQSEFYKKHLAEHDLGATADLERLPLTFKRHLAAASPYGMLIVPPERVWHYHETSGTTGEPIATWCGLPELQQMGAVVCEMVPELAEPTMMLNRFPLFAPVSFVFEEALRKANGCHIAAGNLSWDVPFTRALDFIHRLKVNAFSGLPLEPILLRELALMEGLDLKRDLGTLRVLFLGGAILPPAMRRVIESDWGARIVEIYGSNETLLMGVGCPAGALHLCEDLLEFEVLDPQTHARVAPGDAGVMTITSLVHTAMPLVRYFTGDLVRVFAEPCSCGRPGRTAQVLGRYDDVIRQGDASISHYDLLDAAYEFTQTIGARVFFIVVLKVGLRLLVELKDPPSSRLAAPEQVLQRRVGLPIHVEYLGENEVMDRSALFRGPKIYKPSQISDWRGEGRKTITIMEALLEWPDFPVSTVAHVLRRQVKNFFRRRRFGKEERRS